MILLSSLYLDKVRRSQDEGLVRGQIPCLMKGREDWDCSARRKEVL